MTTEVKSAAKFSVLHTFESPRHGAYPASGVIRDAEGNLYGTTNGSFSDIGGGGLRDAGVVFKIDHTGHQTLIHDFTGGSDGSTPNGLIRDWAGNLYGTTASGGTAGAGVVFKIDSSDALTVLYTFKGGNDGNSPVSLVRDGHGDLYGATTAGGASGYGVVFKIAASGGFRVLYTFTGGADGANPTPNVALDAHGNLYGTTNFGGNQVGQAGAGVVFMVDPSGHETVLHTFTGGNDGANPNGVIRDDRDSALYGTTSGGGASAAGVVFKINASGHETTLYTFSGGDDGGYSDAPLTLGRDGVLFGTTNNGGKANLGVVFKLDTSGHETVLYSFTRSPEGHEPNTAGVTLDENGNLYGTTSFGAEGGEGAVYKIDFAGAPSVLYTFPGEPHGQYPYNNGVLLGSDGRLYGTTFYGGLHGVGVLYELNERNEDTALYTFDQSTDAGFGQPTWGVTRDQAGNFYGTTFIGQTDYGFGFGVIYKVGPAGSATVLHNFAGGHDGADPYGGVIVDSQGNVYGTASGGGASGNGVVFEIDKSGHFKVLYSFSGGADGGGPLGGLLRDSSGVLYGTTNGGGTAGAGVVFKLDSSGKETVLYSFTGGTDGGYPLGGVASDKAGNLYGTTDGGGAAGAGVVFKLDPSGKETVLHSFTGGADGGYPFWVTPVLDSAGNVYGTTAYGGADNGGVVFKLDPKGHETVLHTFRGGDDGAQPYIGLTAGWQGELYGTTAFGGRGDIGVVFKIAP